MLAGDFSKTFSSATYQQIVAMKDTEQGYAEGMAPLYVINIFFLHDETTHLITLSYSRNDMGKGLRQQTFENLNTSVLETFITDRLNEGIQ